MPKRITKQKSSKLKHQANTNIPQVITSSDEELDLGTSLIIDQIEAEWDYKHSCVRW